VDLAGEAFTFRADLEKRGLAGGLPTGYAGAAHTIWSLSFRFPGPAGPAGIGAG